jgi:hypothetical protein
MPIDVTRTDSIPAKGADSNRDEKEQHSHNRGCRANRRKENRAIECTARMEPYTHSLPFKTSWQISPLRFR